jgi:pilus assembly protein FimV
MLVFAIGLVAACSSSGSTGTPGATGPAGATGAPPAGTGAAQSTTNAPISGTPKTLDACSLITAAEASTAIGGEPVDPGAPPEPGASSCLFTSHPAQGTDLNSVEISITGSGAFNPNQKSIAGLTITPVSGVGDAAYYVSIGAGFQVLSVRKGQTTFTTSVLLKDASDSQLMDAEKTLAMLILSRI